MLSCVSFFCVLHVTINSCDVNVLLKQNNVTIFHGSGAVYLVKTSDACSTMEQLIEAVKFMAARQAGLGTLLIQQHQHQRSYKKVARSGTTSAFTVTSSPSVEIRRIGWSSRRSSYHRWRQETCWRQVCWTSSRPRLVRRTWRTATTCTWQKMTLAVKTKSSKSAQISKIFC